MVLHSFPSSFRFDAFKHVSVVQNGGRMRLLPYERDIYLLNLRHRLVIIVA